MVHLMLVCGNRWNQEIEVRLGSKLVSNDSYLCWLEVREFQCIRRAIQVARHVAYIHACMCCLISNLPQNRAVLH